jgi:hypothetical protein
MVAPLVSLGRRVLTADGQAARLHRHVDLVDRNSGQLRPNYHAILVAEEVEGGKDAGAGYPQIHAETRVLAKPVKCILQPQQAPKRVETAKRYDRHASPPS